MVFCGVCFDEKRVLCAKSQHSFFLYICLNLKINNMASIKLGAIVADIKGKIAGNYFAKRNNTTILARCGSKLTKADAGRQTLQKARLGLSNVSFSWRALSAEQQKVWGNQASLLTWYTKVGIPYTPSGYQLFCQCNLNRLKVNLVPLTYYVPPTEPADVNKVQVAISAGGVITYSYAGLLSGNKYVVISASYPNSTGVKYPKGGYKVISVLGADDSGPTVITTDYYKVYGVIPLAGMVFFKADIVDADSGIQEGSKLTKADAGLV